MSGFGKIGGITFNTTGNQITPGTEHYSPGYREGQEWAKSLLNPTSPVSGEGNKTTSPIIEPKPQGSSAPPASSGGYKVDPNLPKAVREIIERNEKAGTPENIGGEVEKIPDGAAGDGILDKMKGALGGTIGGLMGQIGGMAGSGASAVGGKLAGPWIRIIIISVGIIVLVAGLFLLGQGATVKVSSEVASSGAGKAVKKLIPAGKAASIVKGVVS